MPSLLEIGLVIIKQYRNFAVLSAYKNCARFLIRTLTVKIALMYMFLFLFC